VLTGVLTAAVTGLVAAAESTRDYRMEMGKLDTAFVDSGFSSEAATTAYKELVGVLGEYDQSVEAANHLAKLTDNEKELATWTGDILPGVFATFGDSLPIEGLTEAANETAKVGQVTGPLADALNWAGIAEDEFNESLAKCTSEQERQRLITETLAGVYGEASAAYKETNADIIAANLANDNWTASLASVGAAVEPLITQVKDMGATLLTQITPVIEGLLNNLPSIGIALAGVTAAVVAFKIAAIAATAAQQGMTLAQYAGAAAQNALNIAMNANPIGLIILGITALVTAFPLLWNNCEGFREFWINLWEKIKTAAINAWEGIKVLPEKIYNGIKSAIDKVKKWGEDSVSKAKTAATNMLNNVTSTLKNLPGKIWSAIVGAVQKVATWGSNMFSKAKAAASNVLNNVVSTLKQLPGKIWSAIIGAVQKVAQWGTNMVSKARTAMNNVATAVVNTLKSLPQKVLSIGANLVTGLWNGISNKFNWLKNKISGFTSGVLDGIKGFFGIHSPSTETAWMGEMLDAGLAEGMMDNINDPIKAMKNVSRGELDAAMGDVGGISFDRSIQQRGAAAASAAAADTGVLAKLDRILAAIEAGQVLAIDGDALVGATADKFDKRLGQRRQLAVRGALS
jgi:phage-related protein